MKNMKMKNKNKRGTGENQVNQIRLFLDLSGTLFEQNVCTKGMHNTKMVGKTSTELLIEPRMDKRQVKYLRQSLIK